MEAFQGAAGLEVPGVGMRGGLGRTILTAFLILAIVPLSVVETGTLPPVTARISRRR